VLRAPGGDLQALAALPYSFVTMWLAVRGEKNVLVHGAAGGLGTLALRMLSAGGPRLPPSVGRQCAPHVCKRTPPRFLTAAKSSSSRWAVRSMPRSILPLEDAHSRDPRCLLTSQRRRTGALICIKKENERMERQHQMVTDEGEAEVSVGSSDIAFLTIPVEDIVATFGDRTRMRRLGER
jgi:hypothetical protein